MKNSCKTYADIDRQLKILKIEREISYYKIAHSVQSISNRLSPTNIIKIGIGSLGTSIGSSKEIKILIYSAVLKFFIKKIFKR